MAVPALGTGMMRKSMLLERFDLESSGCFWGVLQSGSTFELQLQAVFQLSPGGLQKGS